MTDPSPDKPFDMMSDEWLDEFERNWGIKDQSSNTDIEPQRKNNRRTTDSDREEPIPSPD